MEKEIGCINSRAMINYVKAKNNGDSSALLVDLHPEIDALPDPEGFLTDPNNWISCDVATEMLRRAGTLLNDKLVAFNIARYAAENISFGYAQGIIIKAFGSTKRALKNLQKIQDKWNRSKKVELVELNRNDAILRLHWDSSMTLTKDLCLFNQGAYTFLPVVWGGNPLSLREECCYFDGAPYCEYHMKWPARDTFKAYISRFLTSKTVMRETISEMEEGKRILEEKYVEVNRLNVELNYKIKQLLAIQETGKAILSVLNLDQLLTVIMSILSNVCKINRALIMLVNNEEGCLEYLHSVGFEGEIPEDVKNYYVPLHRVSNILARVANTGRPEYIPKVETSRLRKDNIILAHGKPVSVYVVPLITRSKVIGVIATDAADEEGIAKETRETIEIFGPQIAIAIENARLYTRLQEQMNELKKSHALLSRAEKFSFLGNLAARLAHEIKNPMTAIGTFIQMLPERFNDDEFRNDFYKIAMEETQRVNNLITELLDLVKTKKSKFEYTDIHAVIDRMILLLSPRSHSKQIDVIREYDPNIGLVWLDSEKIKQVILNLLSNAVDFTPEGGRIDILTEAVPKERPDHIRIEIKDTGIGIPESMLEKIFDPYFTTKHKSSIHNGTGLGLFIAHRNMQDHSGTIEVNSKVDEGTTFILKLPSKTDSEFTA